MSDIIKMIIVVVVVTGIALGGFIGWKHVSVWSASQSGKAVLAEAEFSRQARVMEAQAKKDAAELEGQAELIKAKYSSEANKALSEGLGGPEGYLRYLYIRMLEEQSTTATTTIYIPTEAGIPILEANRLEKQ